MFKRILDIWNGIYELVIGSTISTEKTKKEGLSGVPEKVKINKSMTNVIKFPSSQIKRPVRKSLSDKDRELLLLKEKVNAVEHSLEYVTMESISMVHRLGFDITREDFIKDVTHVVDAIRGLMYRASDIKSPIHEWVDNTYVMSDDKEQGDFAYHPEWYVEDEKD